MDRLIDKLVSRMLALHEARAVSAVWDCFSRNATVAEDVLLGTNAWCVNRGRPDDIRIGRGTVCRGVLRGYGGGSAIVIGEDVYLGDDVLISCIERVEIGRGVLLAHGVQVFDNDSHPVDPEERSWHWRQLRYAEKAAVRIGRAPVAIGVGAWIGMNSIVMKGVTIGESAIVAAGSVVTADVPPLSLAAGNPARVIRSLETVGAR